LTKFYRNFIPNNSHICAPLTRLIKKDLPFTWGKEEDAAFQDLKAVFCSAPLLAHFKPQQPIAIEADASDFAMSMILSQPHADGSLHPVAFASRKFPAAEINYDVHGKELLSIVTAFKTWWHYIEGSPHRITVYSDHKNLQYSSS
jgi:hypothetical protein